MDKETSSIRTSNHFKGMTGIILKSIGSEKAMELFKDLNNPLLDSYDDRYNTATQIIKYLSDYQLSNPSYNVNLLMEAILLKDIYHSHSSLTPKLRNKIKGFLDLMQDLGNRTGRLPFVSGFLFEIQTLLVRRDRDLRRQAYKDNKVVPDFQYRDIRNKFIGNLVSSLLIMTRDKSQVVQDEVFMVTNHVYERASDYRNLYVRASLHQLNIGRYTFNSVEKVISYTSFLLHKLKTISKNKEVKDIETQTAKLIGTLDNQLDYSPRMILGNMEAFEAFIEESNKRS